MKTKNKENILRSVTEKQHLIFRENTLKAFNRSRGVRKERMKIKNCQPGISLKRQVMLRVELGPFKKICWSPNPQSLRMGPYLEMGLYRGNRVKARSLQWALIQYD